MFNKQATHLIMISMMLNFASLLSSVFLNIFLWRITSDIIYIAQYNLVLYMVYTIFFPLCAYVLKKRSVILVLRISIVLQILYFTCIILSGERAADYIYIFGVITGISGAANANSINQLTVRFTDTENRSKFLSVSGTLNSIAAMISPMLSGMIIILFQELTGYYVIFTISIVLYIISFAMSSWFGEKTLSREFHFFKTFFSCPQAMIGVNATQFIIGVRDGIFGFLINILVFDIVQTESVFGAATSFSKFIVVLAYWAGSRWVNKNNLFKHLRYSMWLMFAAPIPLFILANQLGVISQMILDSIAAPLVAITLNSLIFNNVESSIKNDNLEELLAVREVWLDFGKVVGVVGFLLLYPMLSQMWIFIIVMVTNLCYVGSYHIFKLVERKNIASIYKG